MLFIFTQLVEHAKSIASLRVSNSGRRSYITVRKQSENWLHQRINCSFPQLWNTRCFAWHPCCSVLVLRCFSLIWPNLLSGECRQKKHSNHKPKWSCHKRKRRFDKLLFIDTMCFLCSWYERQKFPDKCFVDHRVWPGTCARWGESALMDPRQCGPLQTCDSFLAPYSFWFIIVYSQIQDT